VVALQKEKRVRVSLVLDGAFAENRFAALLSCKPSIEAEIGCPVIWSQPQDRSQKISLERDGDPLDRDDWDDQHEWLADTLELFQKVFTNRLRQIQVPSSTNTDTE